jgi:hypothetical protein
MLKMAQRYSPQSDQSRTNGANDQISPYLGPSPNHQMIFDVQDIVEVGVANVPTIGMPAKEQNGNHPRTTLVLQ